MSDAIELLRRIVTYAREDRARTPGFTRLARALAEAERIIQEEPPPDWKALAARLAEALGMQTPSARAAGCWCPNARDVAAAGHGESCDRARAALAAYAAANSSKNLESSDATKTGQSAGA